METLLRDPSRTFIRCVEKSIGQIRKSSFFLRDVSLGIFHEFLFCFNSENSEMNEETKTRKNKDENRKKIKSARRIVSFRQRKLNNVSNLRHDDYDDVTYLTV